MEVKGQTMRDGSYTVKSNYFKHKINELIDLHIRPHVEIITPQGHYRLPE